MKSYEFHNESPEIQRKQYEIQYEHLMKCPEKFITESVPLPLNLGSFADLQNNE